MELTLGTHYVMWICAVGDGLSGSNIKVALIVSDTARKMRMVRLSERKSPTLQILEMEGCMDKNAFTNNNEYLGYYSNTN